MNPLPTVEIYSDDFQLTMEPTFVDAPPGDGVDLVAERVKLTPQQWAALIIAIIQAIAAALGAMPTTAVKGKGGAHESPPNVV